MNETDPKRPYAHLGGEKKCPRCGKWSREVWLGFRECDECFYGPCTEEFKAKLKDFFGVRP
jgi:hypothetical protein